MTNEKPRPCFECGRMRNMHDRRRRLCKPCYARLHARRELPTITLEMLFERHVHVAASGCWEWEGAHSDQGYGRYGTDYTHRLFYERANGPIPDGLHIDHLCRNRICCNPEHLEAVPCRVNVLRGVGPTAANAARTHCSRRGHPFDEENAFINAQGFRSCRACRREEGSLPRSQRTRQSDFECSVDECFRPAKSRGMCGAHAERARAGRPMLVPIRARRTECQIEWNESESYDADREDA